MVAEPRLSGWRSAALAGLMAALGGVVAAREGADGTQIVIGVVLAGACSCAGCRTLGPDMSIPLDRHRFRAVSGYTLLLGGPLLASGLPHVREAGFGASVSIGILAGACLFGFIWLVVALPHRGLLGRMTSWHTGYPRCPACGRATPAGTGRCIYCDAELPPTL